MIYIHPVVFTKGGLPAVPSAEMLFHLLLAQMANEILILRKQMMLAGNSVGEAGAITDAAVATAHVNLRLLAGRLFEGYQLLKGPPAGQIFQSFKGELEPEAIAARRSIMAYFGAGASLIERIRNKASFHWDYPSNVEAFEHMPDNLPLTDYIAFEAGNCLYYSGALLSQGQLAEIVGVGDTGLALDQIHEDVTNATVWFDTFVQGYMLAFARRYLSPSQEKFLAIRRTLEGCPDIQTATMPFFLDTESVQHLKEEAE